MIKVETVWSLTGQPSTVDGQQQPLGLARRVGQASQLTRRAYDENEVPVYVYRPIAPVLLIF